MHNGAKIPKEPVEKGSDRCQLPLPADQLGSIGSAKQIIIVNTKYTTDFHAKVDTFEWQGSRWEHVFASIPAVIGKNGLAEQKREGDGKSPAGTFTLGTMFGSASRPEGVKWKYRQTTENDFWVDDPNSPLYNTWQTGPAKGRWNSAETLKRSDGQYKYAIVINYNDQRIPGRGSAIFMHLWSGPDRGTAGCTAMAEADLLKIMRWLEPGKKPVIVQTTETAVR